MNEAVERDATRQVVLTPHSASVSKNAGALAGVLQMKGNPCLFRAPDDRRRFHLAHQTGLSRILSENGHVRHIDEGHIKERVVANYSLSCFVAPEPIKDEVPVSVRNEGPSINFDPLHPMRVVTQDKISPRGRRPDELSLGDHRDRE